MRLLILCLLVLPACLAAQQQPTAAEAAFIYELNRARSNPQRYDAEESLGGILAGVIARPPLATNQNLVQSARFHTTEMSSVPYYFAHQSAVTGDWPNKMARDANYPLNAGLPNNTNNIESLAAGGALTVTSALRLLIEDVGVNPPGHRNHLLATGSSAAFYAQFREIGVGYSFNASAPYQRYYAIHTGFRDNDPVWLTGVVYSDGNNNGRYDEGEGLSGVTIGATGPSTLNTTTSTGGTWALAVTSGSWNLTCSGGGFAGTGTKTVVVGSANREVDFVSGRAAGELDFEYQSTGGGPALTITGNLTTFSSPAPGTPSAQQSYTVSGLRLLGNVTVSAPAQFQVSTTSGSGFTGSVVLTPTAGTLAATTIYVRFNPSGASGASGNVTHASTGALDSPRNVTGTVSTNPAVFCNPTTLNFNANQLGAGVELSYTVEGYNLTAPIGINAPADFGVSLTSGGGYSANLSLTPSGGTVAPTTIYVYYLATTMGTSGNVTNVSGSASQNVAVSGTVSNAPSISVAPTSLTLISPSSGTPSAEQTFTVSGQYLGNDITITAPTGFDMTLTSGSGYVTSLNLTPAAGTVSSTTVYVRFLGGTPATSNITSASNFAITRNVAASGTIAPPPNIGVSLISLGLISPGIGLTSNERTFTVSGTNLVGSVTVTASAEFEVSLTPGAGYSASVNASPTAGTLAPTTIYVRFTPTVGALNGTATVTSPGATTRVVTLGGTIGSSNSDPDKGGDSGGGGCAAGSSSGAWLLLLLTLPLIARSPRRKLGA